MLTGVVDSESLPKNTAFLIYLVVTQRQGCVAFLPWVSVTLKALKPKALDLEPQTLGEHIKRRRLQLGLSQPQAAAALGVDPITVLNWEKGKTEPLIRAFPAIFRFLSYATTSQSSGVGEQLLHFRRQRGWSIREAAAQLGVDSTTWGDWERGKLILFRKHRMAVAQLLGLNERELNSEMGARWNMKASR
jgi:transcriptional regulator with XRE-family HTH domain